MQKVSQLGKIRRFYSSVKTELNKVIFPIKEQIKSAFISVIIVVTVITLYLSLIDTVMSYSLNELLN